MTSLWTVLLFTARLSPRLHCVENSLCHRASEGAHGVPDLFKQQAQDYRILTPSGLSPLSQGGRGIPGMQAFHEGTGGQVELRACPSVRNFFPLLKFSHILPPPKDCTFPATLWHRASLLWLSGSVTLLPGPKIQLQKIDPAKDAILASFRTNHSRSNKLGIVLKYECAPLPDWSPHTFGYPSESTPVALWRAKGLVLMEPITLFQSLLIPSSIFSILGSSPRTAIMRVHAGVHVFCLAALLRHLLHSPAPAAVVYRRPTGFHYARVVGIWTICKQADQTAVRLEHKPHTQAQARANAAEAMLTNIDGKRHRKSEARGLQNQNNTFTKTRWSCPCPYPFATPTDLPSVLLVQSWHDDRIPNLSCNHPETHTISHRSARTWPVKVLVKPFEKRVFLFFFSWQRRPPRTSNLVFRGKKSFSSHEG